MPGLDDEDEKSWGPLRTEWLIIPDFHVSGPKGYGLEPWLVEDLGALLKWRMDERCPTVIFAVDPWALGEQIGALVNRHYAYITPLESVRKVHAGTQYLVILRSISLMLASRMKARAVRLRFS
ncbi:MAG: hypothetical protein IIA72_13170 [Proteobacteria bacterium]|nr:hypothetical protein [Pseudomonadota bacterium]